jgi:uncharacterized membrane protein YciS (DUF1049 family)
MKILLNILAILILAAAGFVAYQNTPTAINFVILKSTYAHLSVGILLIAFLFAGLIAGCFFVTSHYIVSKTKLKEYKRKLEKTAVQSSSDSSKVEVLEAKIVVLEKALKSALEKNNE